LLQTRQTLIHRAGGGFIAQQRNAVLVGGTGTGKTHLAIAIARSCIRGGARGRFYNVVDLVNRLELEIFYATTNREIDAAFADIAQKRCDALLVSPTRLYIDRRVQLVTLAIRDRLPVIFPSRDFAEAGGLMTYGTDIADEYRQMGVYVGRVLKGTKPADLPVEQSTRFEFVINLQTARTLGLTVPPTLIAQAHEVIE
jgi:ABC transporter substrate binding protein/IstB-like ATP binding protein